MGQKSSEITKRESKKIGFNSNPSKFERVFSTGDFNGCVLVVPEPLRRTSTSCFTKEGFPSIDFEAYSQGRKKAGS